MEERTGELAPQTIFVNFAEVKRFTKTLPECNSDRDYLFYWFLNGWRYDKSGLPKELETKSITKTLSRACEIAAFTPEKKTLYNKSLMNERDILAQKDFAVKEARAEGLAEGKRETAKHMLKENAPIDFICRVTGLSYEEIQGL